MSAANAFGIEVSALDVVRFLEVARLTLIALAVAGIAVVARRGRAPRLVAGVVFANAYVWFVTNFPLQRLYALGPSRDRINNLGMAHVVAVGGRPFETTQVFQLHFEPFWGWLVALLGFGDPTRLLRLYPFLTLIVLVAVVVSLYLGLRPGRGSAAGFDPWERAMMAGFATLLCAAPLDFAEPLRNPWAMTFLLKPNHALGLALIPWFVWSFSRIRGVGGRILAGVLLHLVAWAFVLHMVYVAAGLGVFMALSWTSRRADLRRDLRDVATVIGINLVLVSPYLWMLLRGYPVFVPSPHATISSAHLLEPSTAIAVVFALAVWGAAVALRRDERACRLVACLWFGAWLVWLAYLALAWFHLARERDDLLYYLRILTALLAGLGAWDLLRRAGEKLRGGNVSVRTRAAVLCLVAFPYTIAYWWNPMRMDSYFPASLTPLPPLLAEPAGYLRREAPENAVVAGDPAFTRYAAALAGRRGLLVLGMNAPRDHERRLRLERMLLEGGPAEEAFAEARVYGVRYVAVTSALLERHPSVTVASLDRNPLLRRAHLSSDEEGSFVALYELVKGT